MKNLASHPFRFIPAALGLWFLASLLVCPSPATAQSYWDPNGTKASPGSGGAGTWNAANVNWWVSGSSDTTWTANNIAYFEGSAGIVTLGAAETANGLTFTTAGYVINGTSTLTLAGTPTITVPASGTTTIGCVLAGSAGCTVTGGALTLTNVETYTGVTTIGSGATLTIGGAGQLGSGSYAGNITDSGAFIYNSTAAQTLSAVISGSGTLTQNGSGALTLSGTSNSYSGITTVNSSYVSIARDLSLGAVPTSSSPGWNGTCVPNQLTLNCGSTANVGIRWTASGQLPLNAARGVYLTAGSHNAYFGSSSGSIATNASPISGPGNFQSGAGYNSLLGTNVLTGLSTYTGTTTISSGRLLLGVSGALPSTTALTIAADNGLGTAGAILDLGGYNQTIGSLSSSTGVGGTGGPDMPTIVLSGALTVNETSSSTFNGNIICTGGSLSIGSGTLILGGGIVGATVSAAGGGITAPATFSVSGSGGAAVSPSLGVTASTFTINQGTQTYSVAPTVTISGGGGSPTATATANLSSGLVTSITITSPGGGYTSAPTIAFSGGTVLVSGTAPTGTGNANSFQLVNAVVTANGSGYTSAPTLTLSSGTGTATAQLASVALAASTSIGGAGNLTINSVINGGASDTLTKTGAGTVTLANANTYSGPTTISSGELVGVTGGSCANSTVTVSDGATIGVSITDNTRQWTCGGLTCNSGAPALDFNFGYSGTPSTSLAPLNVSGAVAFNGTPTITIEAGSFPAGSGTYPLMTWTSTSGTPPTTATLPPHVTGTLGVSGNTLYLYATGPAEPLRWTGAAGNGLWDINTSQNWKDSAGTATDYEQTTVPGDAVILDETYIAASQNITLDTVVTPASVTVNNSTYNYTVSGSGAIAGPIGLTKQGSATLTLGCANTYSGSTTVAGGTLSVGVDNNLGGVPASTTAASIVLSNATLSANASFALSPNRGITMQANSTLDVASGKTLSYAGVIAGPSFNLTKTGAGTFIPSQNHNSYSGNTIISAGILQTGGDNTTGGTPSNLGAAPSSFTANNITLAGGTLQGNNPNFQFGANRGITLTADSGLSALAGDKMGILGPITGNYGLTMTSPGGTGYVYLEGANTYTGNTIISSGVLALALSGSINNSPSISIAAGAALDVSSNNAAPFTLASGQSLTASGSGTMSGVVTNVASSTAAVLNGAASGTVSLGSQPIILNFTPTSFTGDATHPSLYVLQGTLSLNGNSFTVTNAAATPLGVGTYALIQQASGSISSSGSYSVSVTGTGLAAGTAASISVTGGSVNLDVTSTGGARPVINGITLSGASLILSGTNGSDSGTFYVLTSTNVALPLSNWTSIATGAFSPTGAFSVTNAVGVSPRRFFVIQQVP